MGKQREALKAFLEEHGLYGKDIVLETLGKLPDIFTDPNMTPSDLRAIMTRLRWLQPNLRKKATIVDGSKEVYFKHAITKTGPVLKMVKRSQTSASNPRVDLRRKIIEALKPGDLCKGKTHKEFWKCLSAVMTFSSIENVKEEFKKAKGREPESDKELIEWLKTEGREIIYKKAVGAKA